VTGSTATARTTRLPRPTFAGIHVVAPSTVLKMPRRLEPRYAVVGSVGSRANRVNSRCDSTGTKTGSGLRGVHVAPPSRLFQRTLDVAVVAESV
jgi:hypothetical protein